MAKCSSCNGDVVDIDEKLVCQECGNIQSELGRFTQQLDFSAPGVNVSLGGHSNTTTKKVYFSNTGCKGPYHNKFEDALEYICNQLKTSVSFKNTMRTHYYLAFSKWRPIRRIDPTYSYVCAALAHIVYRSENKGTTLADIGIKLNLKYYTIGKISMKIQSVAGILVDELSEFSYLDRGCNILKKSYSYSHEDCESTKRLASELIKFCKTISLSDGRNPSSIYCACLYLAQCYKLTTISQDILNHFNSNGIDNGDDPKQNNTDINGKRKAKGKSKAQELMKPFFEDLVKEMNAPSHGTNLRIKEIEAQLTSYYKESPFFSQLVNPLNFYQWLPMILKDFLIKQQPDENNQEEKEEESSGEDKEFEIEKNLEKENNDDSFDEEENNLNNIVDDENLNDIPTKIQTPENRKRSNCEIAIDDESPNAIKKLKSLNKESNDCSSGDESSDTKSISSLASTTAITTSTTATFKGTKKIFEAILKSDNPNTPFPPAYIKSEYKKTIKKLRLIKVKLDLLGKGQIDKSRITKDDIQFYDKFKEFKPAPSIKLEGPIEKLLIEGVGEDTILEGFTDLDSIQLDCFLNNNKNYLDDEELNDLDIPDESLQLYIRSGKEKEEWNQILKSTYVKDDFEF
ncbi:hypothetical protein DICPUDRAFT_27213 [Dictyostelium purpureum]|uniref:Uncharacterized protein n=1 Tax=Dictyostelium purpureum TaxID=5786 RepID=F0Z9S6_DICPU|nr:uncharacterized protein DICPUDRAFT_27213 [Dictyostelium purpureum]EGC39294.1 hypothetical protein DICPUDRAFT_27213 [Dictyostelium purpureum]|eukprot:XP_003284198.1 hypothetical protein DICPUDRAFT_27213 [Dictyostelium purpureum]